jgi:hypothetical protein
MKYIKIKEFSIIILVVSILFSQNIYSAKIEPHYDASMLERLHIKPYLEKQTKILIDKMQIKKYQEYSKKDLLIYSAGVILTTLLSSSNIPMQQIS